MNEMLTAAVILSTRKPLGDSSNKKRVCWHDFFMFKAHASGIIDIGLKSLKIGKIEAFFN